ncbi:MAG TPA: HAMP domain-containing sensor histidine kinase [Anaerolineae bacterium]|nr:HAMP domain-containing sensor histidine kinase [Anaerolineae bacterium]HQK15074.1 HAMP domain-containing sensor histidine kinase [Anaerolineae bacterium]
MMEEKRAAGDLSSPLAEGRTTNNPPGIALLCDAQGVIMQVLRDDLALPNAAAGQLFLRLLDAGSWHKALSFLAEIKAQGATFDWELNVAQPEQPTTLHFAGGVTGEGVLMVGATNGRFAAELYEAMTAISNVQTNQLRAMLQERSRMTRAQEEQESSLYDEISRLNNELVAMQRELAQKNAELARLNELKNQFLGMAAHDLRNPLQVIMAFSDILIEDAVDVLSAQQLEYLEHIKATSTFMSQLINDFLSVAVIESGHFHLELGVVDLPTLVEQALTLVSLKARRKGIEINVAQDPTLPNLVIDGEKIKQVLMNLLANAIEHSYPGSTVVLRTRRLDDQVLIEVEDHGVGIAPEDIGRLFNPFEKKQSRKTGGEKSTGLGLAISKQVVAGHGGKIWVKSEVEQGATFYVSLPILTNL